MSVEDIKRPPLPCFVKPMPTPPVYDPGCCGPKGRVQWVTGFDIVIGLINLIRGAVDLARGDPDLITTAAIDVTIGCLLVVKGTILAVGLHKKKRICYTAWLGASGAFLALGVAGLIRLIYLMAVVLADVNAEVTNLSVATAGEKQLIRELVSVARDYYIRPYVGGLIGAEILFLVIQVLCIVGVYKYRAKLAR